MKTNFFSIGAFAALFFLFFVMVEVQNDPWPVPDKYKKMENPVNADQSSVNAGKTLYGLHCKSCHGKEGLGDGTKAAQLETPCGDFTDDTFRDQSDGAIFYKTIEGRGDMPSFRKKLPVDEDVWNIINYIRTL